MSKNKMILLTALGGMLEFYDFAVFGLMSAYIAKLFFPGQTPLLALLSTFMVMALGQITRPLGGIIFGHIGDRIGRKQTFLMSVLIMGSSTLLLGCIPVYASIGIWATLLLLLSRVAQGISVGGELPGGITYVSEMTPAASGYACGVLFAFVNYGLAFGNLVILAATAVFSDAQMLQFGWRIPFVLGGALNIVAFFIRKKLVETPVFTKTDKIEKVPLKTMLVSHSRSFFAAFLLIGCFSAIASFPSSFLPGMMVAILGYPQSVVSLMSFCGAAGGATLIIALAFVSDKVNKKKWLAVLMVFPVIAGYILFSMLFDRFTGGWLPVLLINFASCMIAGIMPSMLPSIFPATVRYSGIAFSYSLGYAVFGSLAPQLATYMYEVSGGYSGPALVLMVSGVIGLLALWLYPRRDYLKTGLNTAHGAEIK